jgi:hypothetical protein
MHMPAMQTDRKRIGLTGDIRFRKQWFTRKMILQVAVIYEVRKWRYPSQLKDENHPFTTEVEWEDADASAALRVMFRLPPFGNMIDFTPSKFPMWEDCKYQSARKHFNEQVYRK